MNNGAKKPVYYQDITVAEANQLYPALCRIHNFYALLLQRMQHRGFDRVDPYYIRVKDALDHLHTVKTWTYYRTDKSSVEVPECKE